MSVYTENMKAAQEVARRNAIARAAVQMGAQGYAYKVCQDAPKAAGDTVCTVYKPNGEGLYVLLSANGKAACSCPAFDKWGAELGTCKHIEFVKREEADAARLDAMTEEEYYSRW